MSAIQPYYKWYKALTKEDLQMPAPEQDDEGDIIIETESDPDIVQRVFRQPYLLRQHIVKDHPDISLPHAAVGKPTQRSLDWAKAFYHEVVEAFDARAEQEQAEQKKIEEERLESEKAGAEPSAKRRPPSYSRRRVELVKGH